MKYTLKHAIVMYIFDNVTEFQLNNAVTNEFHAYIYDDKGEYLIGGEEVKEFINNTVNLIKNS